ncbi:YcgL domain-containing protein [Photorhabdus africana]|uniref:YcgL domain-containing protein n=1 Tax=Photorhabdus africana TaxID=3097554 RepID=UPI002B4104D6|nr:YcgL domain-containing protein [Photorhabdus sp. CRI-LC]
MICAIYRSPKREQTYLYVEKRDNFSRVPEELLKNFGQPQYTMTISLADRTKLAGADIEKVKISLIEQGFYLQIPPPVENLMNGHLSQMEK